eukprot:36255_1
MAHSNDTLNEKELAEISKLIVCMQEHVKPTVKATSKSKWVVKLPKDTPNYSKIKRRWNWYFRGSDDIDYGLIKQYPQQKALLIRRAAIRLRLNKAKNKIAMQQKENKPPKPTAKQSEYEEGQKSGLHRECETKSLLPPPKEYSIVKGSEYAVNVLDNEQKECEHNMEMIQEQQHDAEEKDDLEDMTKDKSQTVSADEAVISIEYDKANKPVPINKTLKGYLQCAPTFHRYWFILSGGTLYWKQEKESNNYLGVMRVCNVQSVSDNMFKVSSSLWGSNIGANTAQIPKKTLLLSPESSVKSSGKRRLICKTWIKALQTASGKRFVTCTTQSMMIKPETKYDFDYVKARNDYVNTANDYGDDIEEFFSI